MRGGKELCTRSTNSTCCPHALLGVSVGKFHTRWRRSVLFACGLMCIFPAISARKGADERKVGFSQNIETPQKYMRNFRKLSVPIQTAHGYPCAHVPTGGSFLNPQSLRRPLTPPPLSAPDRGSKNIAEPARLRSLRVRADAAFPSNIGAKGSRREESRIFFKTSKRRRSTCGTFGNCQFRYRLPTAIPAYLFQQAGVF